jgi:hypothetical protein
MNFDKLSTYLIGIFLMSILLNFAYQGIIEQHLYYDSPKINIRLNGYQAILFGLAKLIAATYLIYIFLSKKKRHK